MFADPREPQKRELLAAFGSVLVSNCLAPEVSDFHGGKPIRILPGARRIAGPRSGIVRLSAGFDTQRLYRILTLHGCVNLRELLRVAGWRFAGDPQVYPDGEMLSIEIPFPDELQLRDVRMRELLRYGTDTTRHQGRAIVGVNQSCAIVSARFDSSLPNLLVAGTSGSGKTTGLLTLTTQLALNTPGARFVLVDGKGDLAPLQGLPGQVGPVAYAPREALDALGWVLGLVQERNQQKRAGRTWDGPHPDGPVYLVIDEGNLFTQSDAFARALYLVTRAGRSVSVHTIFGVQAPRQETFGAERGTKANFAGRLALHVVSDVESRVALDRAFPRAELLGDHGDGYFLAGGKVERVQVAYYGAEEIHQAAGGPVEFQRWPRFDAATLGGAEADGDAPAQSANFTNEEAVIGLYAALQGWRFRRTNSLLRAQLGYGMGQQRVEQQLLPLGAELAQLWERLAARVPAEGDAG